MATCRARTQAAPCITQAQAQLSGGELVLVHPRCGGKRKVVGFAVTGGGAPAAHRVWHHHQCGGIKHRWTRVCVYVCVTMVRQKQHLVQPQPCGSVWVQGSGKVGSNALVIVWASRPCSMHAVWQCVQARLARCATLNAASGCEPRATWQCVVGSLASFIACAIRPCSMAVHAGQVGGCSMLNAAPGCKGGKGPPHVCT